MAAPRVALGLTSLLTLSTQFNSAQQNLPAVATIKALDIWMFACMFMVFASLLVYAFSYTCFRIKQAEEQKPQSTAIVITSSSNYKKSSKKHFQKPKQSKSQCISIDKTARIVFPGLFIAFNVYYWNTYLKQLLALSFSKCLPSHAGVPTAYSPPLFY
uniref:Neurotransmitter-gated ion-channel transmembrane domain-containing protein n=1 Tax=Strigamia maritima TaxID=126957 RepID=T1JI33_STRMM